MGAKPLEIDDLLADLELLRKNAGFVQRRIANAPLVRELLSGQGADSFERLKSRFTSAVHSLDESEADLLLDVYGLSERTSGMTSLLKRRQVHGAHIGRGVETVANREGPALAHLADRLLRGNYAQSPLTIDVPEMHDGIIYDTVSYAMLVRDRKWVSTQEYYSFTAEFDVMDFVTISRSFAATLTPHPKMQFRVNTRETSRGFNDHFWSRNEAMTEDAPMYRGGRYALRFLLEPPADDAGKNLLQLTRALHARALLASFKVRFEGELPARLWKVDRVSFFDNPGRPHEGNLLELDEAGEITFRLRDFHSGLFAGVAWEWG
ncbi:MAG: hypothetical protein ACTH30_10190 [Leucobacter sp.]